MKNIPTIFVWDKETRAVVNKPMRMVDWVFQGKGVATRKHDGVAIRVEQGKVYVRYEWKPGAVPPAGFTRVQDPDPKRPHAALPGWVLVPSTFLTSPRGTDERALKEAWLWLLEDLKKIAFNNRKAPKAVNPYAPLQKEVDPEIPDGTYELCGPKIRGNKDGLKSHMLLLHGADVVKNVPRTFDKLKEFLETYDGEGIVWHYKLGGVVLMAKIKRRDFGFHTRISKADFEMAYRLDPRAETIRAEDAAKTAKPVAIATGDTVDDSMLAEL